MNIELFRELTEAHGSPGREEAIRDIVIRELKPFCELSSDSMGNVIALKRGSKREGAKKLMIAGHMDEIGFRVKHISDKGFLRIVPTGGWDPRQMASQRVKVHTREGLISGLLMMSTKPKHMLQPGEGAKEPSIDDFFIDIGMSGDAAKERVELGDAVTMDRTFIEMGELCTCKAMDDRVAVFVMIEAMKAAKAHEVDVYGVATVQEEVGLRGAVASGWAIHPDVCVALDVTLANDIPGLTDEFSVTKLGEGTAIKILDSSLICHPKVVRHFRDLAEKNEIKYQLEVLPFGGTDAGGVQRLHGGIPSFTLSVPCRYVHTVNETVHKGDVQASIDLLARYIEDCQNGDYGYGV
ncbi:MAG: M42 family metallopeptidase [Fimbriimonadaceae bacterium]|nr:M42 family metallopeptidase [Fimbriimonadaceae bacterium]QYK54695.1 MAG: M42 family metallopeptidase [Fimbriimonadaceae bacterium]